MNHLREVGELWLRSALASAVYYVRHVLPAGSALAATRRLEGSRRGRRAFVFANGPSLRKLDARKIAKLQHEEDFDVFGINAYVRTDFARVARPDWYVMTDPAQWTMALSDAEVEHLDVAGRAAARADFRRVCEETWSELKRARARLFVPVEQWPCEGYESYAFCADANPFLANVYDITRPLGIRPLTAYRALSIACYLGYDRIFVCGIDNDAFKSITVDRDNVKYARYEHFYDSERDVQILASKERLSKSLYLTALTFGSVEKFAKYPIVNLDPESLVDALPKAHALDVYGDR